MDCDEMMTSALKKKVGTAGFSSTEKRREKKKKKQPQILACWREGMLNDEQ